MVHNIVKTESLARVRELLPDAHKDRHPFTKKDVPILIELLQDKESCNRADALVALCKLRARKAVPAMIARLRDSSWVVRCDAAEVLGAMGDSRAIRPLRRALKSRNRHVRGYVIVALGDLGDWASRPRFERMYRGRSTADRISSASALYTLTGEETYLEELGRLLREASDWHLRFGAFHDLQWVMRPKDKPAVRRWFKAALRSEDSPGLRKDLRKALAQLGR